MAMLNGMIGACDYITFTNQKGNRIDSSFEEIINKSVGKVIGVAMRGSNPATSRIYISPQHTDHFYLVIDTNEPFDYIICNQDVILDLHLSTKVIRINHAWSVLQRSGTVDIIDYDSANLNIGGVVYFAFSTIDSNARILGESQYTDVPNIVIHNYVDIPLSYDTTYLVPQMTSYIGLTNWGIDMKDILCDDVTIIDRKISAKLLYEL